MSSSGPRKPTRIAVLDDDAPVRRSLVRFLSSNGFEAVAYSTARAFLDACRCEPPDCAVIDCQMPELTGTDVLEALRKAGSALPVIVFAATDDSGVRRRCNALGVRAFLLKPADGDVLLSAIDASLDCGSAARASDKSLRI